MLARPVVTRRPTWRPGRLPLLLLGGAILRLLVWFWFDGLTPRIWDERDYNAIAVNLAERGEFALSAGDPTALRPPLYPALLAVVYEAAGVENFQMVRLVQIALSLATVWLVYRIGREAFSPSIGLVAAGLSCFYPSLVGFNYLILTETLFTFLVCALLLALIRALREWSIHTFAVAGVLLGAAALTRSVMWPFILVLIPFVLLTGWMRRRGAIRAVAVLAATYIVLVAPWAVRNSMLERTVVIVDTLGGRNFMNGNQPYTRFFRAWDFSNLPEEQGFFYQLEARYPPAELETQGQIDRLALREGLAFVLGNPWLTLQRDVVKFFRFWGLEREIVAGVARGYFGPVPLPVLLVLAILLSGSFAVSLVAGIFGTQVAPADWTTHGLMLLVVVFICAVHTVTVGHSRYHLPLMPIVLLYTASATVHRREIVESRGRRWFGLVCLVASILVLVWTAEASVIDSELLSRLLRGIR